MNRKLVGLVVSLVLLSMLSLASAAIPSKTTQDLVSVVPGSYSGETPVSDSFSVALGQTSQSATDELAAIYQETTTQNTAPIEYFDDTIKDEVAALLPEGYDSSSLSLNEFFPLTVNNYEDVYGDVAVSFLFATPYVDGQPIVALVGIKEADGVMWTALKAEVVDGVVKVYFTKDILEKIQSGEAMMAILSGDMPKV